MVIIEKKVTSRGIPSEFIYYVYVQNRAGKFYQFTLYEDLDDLPVHDLTLKEFTNFLDRANISYKMVETKSHASKA